MGEFLSPQSLTKADVIDALTAALKKGGTPHRLESELIEFPVDLILLKAMADVLPNALTTPTDRKEVLCKILERRTILIIGTCSEDTPITIPEDVLKKTVVLILRQNGHYGFRAPLYSELDASTWEGETDRRPVNFCWDFCQILRNLRTKTEVSMLGVSAGVDSILSLVACQPAVYHEVFKIKTFVAIAGAYHPYLYTLAHPRLISNSTCVIVHHHECDQYSPWGNVSTEWGHIDKNVEVFWSVLNRDTCPQLDAPFHHVAHILISQQAFWTRLLCAEAHDFKSKCKEAKLGDIEATYAVKPTGGWHDTNDREAHFLLLAFCACTAAVDASAFCNGVLSWHSIFIAHLQRMNSSRHTSQLKDLRFALPDHTCAELTYRNVIPCFLAEATLKVVGHPTDPGVMKSSAVISTPIVMNTCHRVGPLSLMHVSFRSKAECATGWTSVWWTHRLCTGALDTTPFDGNCFWPHSADSIPDLDQPCHASFSNHMEDENDLWNDLGDRGCTRNQKGLRIGDAVCFLVTNAAGLSREIFGVVHAVESNDAEVADIANFWLWMLSDVADATMAALSRCETEHGAYLTIAQFQVLKLGQHTHITTSWTSAASANPTIFKAMLGSSSTQRKTPARTTLNHFIETVKEDHSLVHSHLREGMDLAELCDCLREPVVTIVGPPGTGKTHSTTILTAAMSKHCRQRAAHDSAVRKTFPFLHIAWTRKAVQVMLQRFLSRASKQQTLTVVYVGSKGELGFLTQRERDRVRCLSLTDDKYQKWEEVLCTTGSIHVFATVGRTQRSESDSSVIKLWYHIFLLCHMDEGSQVLQMDGLHLPKFLFHTAKFLVSGDLRQLPGFSQCKSAAQSVMSAVMAVVHPFTLTKQYRQDLGLSSLFSCIFYEGQVSDAHNRPQPDTLQFLLVVWGDEDDDDGLPDEFPSEHEATLAVHLWHEMGWSDDARDDCRIMSFYKAQTELIAAKLDALSQHKSISVDSSQGSEFTAGIVSAGRNRCTPKGVGFLNDRRRINVAISRFMTQMVFIIHASMGSKKNLREGGRKDSHLFWANLRKVASELDADYQIGELTTANALPKARVLAEWMRNTRSFTPGKVKGVVSKYAKFFDTYQIDVVGKLNEKVSMRDVAAVETCKETTKEGQLAGAELRKATIAFDNTAREEFEVVDTCRRQRILPMGVASGALRPDDHLSEALFCILSFSKLNKLYHVGTIHLSEQEEDAVRNCHESCLDAILDGLGCLLHCSLQETYDEPACSSDHGSLRKKQNPILAKEICYPADYKVTLRQLAETSENCSAFLKKLYGGGDCSFLGFRGADKHKKLKFARNALLEVILPYAIVKALVLCAREERRHDVDKKGPGTRFYMDPRVASGNTLTEEILRFPKRQKTNHGDGDKGDDKVSVMLYDSHRCDQSKKKTTAGAGVREHCHSLRVLQKCTLNRDAKWIREFKIVD